MSYTAHYAPLGIDLNATLPDLGHPEIPDLVERVLAEPAGARDTFMCPGYVYNGLCGHPEHEPSLHIVKPADGRIWFAHFPLPTDPPEGSPEGDLHAALKERAVVVAEREGLAVESIDERSYETGRGRVRPDVVIAGPSGKLSAEMQISYANVNSVRERTERARAARMLPLWTTHDNTAAWLYRVPSQRVRLPPEWAKVANPGTDLSAEGLRTLEIYPCGTTGPCRHRPKSSCPGKELIWTPDRRVTFDDLLVGMAIGKYVSAPVDGTKWWMITSADRDRCLDAGGDLTEAAIPAVERVTSEGDPLPAQRYCTYGLDDGRRREPRPPADFDAPVHGQIRQARPTATATPPRPVPFFAPYVAGPRVPAIRVIRPGNPCFYGCATPAKLYPAGWRCDDHASWAVAGRASPAVCVHCGGPATPDHVDHRDGCPTQAVRA